MTTADELWFDGEHAGLNKVKLVAKALPVFFDNQLSEDKLREAMEKHDKGNVGAAIAGA